MNCATTGFTVMLIEYIVFQRMDNAYTNGHLGPRLVADFPEIEQVTRIARVTSTGTPMVYQDREFFEEELLYATSNFFDVFSFCFFPGIPRPRLRRPTRL